MNRLFASCVLALATAPVLAQTSSPVVLPAGAAPTNTAAYETQLITGSRTTPIHHQAIYDAGDFKKPVGTLSSIAYRRNNYYSNAIPGGSTTVKITIGYAAHPAALASTTFANNLAIQPTLFFQGTVTWPGVQQGTGPAPFTHVVKAAAPITFLPSSVPGGSVCVDTVLSSSSFANGTYPIDAISPDIGTRTNNPGPNQNCRFSTGRYSNSLTRDISGLGPNGGTWWVRYGGLLPNVPGVATLSFFGTNRPRSWPLPIDMGALGAPGCLWHVGLETGLWVPCSADGSGRAQWPTLTLPAGLGGARFFDQALWFEAAANTAGMVSGWSSEWYIGTGKGPRGATVYRARDTKSSPTGILVPDEEVVICEFTY